MTADIDDKDLLGELLRPIRLTGVFRSWWHVGAPWAVEGDDEQQCAVMHYMASGSCVVGAEGFDDVVLEEGDLALFPTGVAHNMADAPGRRGVPLHSLLTNRDVGASSTVRLGGEGAETRFLCAGMHYETSVGSPLYDALPWILVLRHEQVQAEPLLGALFRQLVAEYERDEAGSDIITLRTFEMAFVCALRPLLGELMESTELMPALQHQGINKALVIIYTRYAEPWSVAGLAREANMSRSAFTATFRKLVGEGPGRHLTGRRMRQAARLLAETDLPQAAMAAKVGYSSVVGFHLAFRNWFGVTPGEYR